MRSLAAALLLVLGLTFGSSTAECLEAASGTSPGGGSMRRARDLAAKSLAGFPVSFEQNIGQTDPRVRVVRSEMIAASP